ncbi:MAG TPA: VLRF1 family aeRF1-type release factor [Baekduia sp.]|uniref:VLRF1 family aeRF1-type release factor n=1 Tax=Baekduia sp. TaxID=2600305 RepID=UPI002D79F076|nr:VLRF1 family aeRF1-type release factor [Baekduia sp.]HET6505742.1 VLRF1 family aeRF1-type release factor [Baekduia sp.]
MATLSSLHDLAATATPGPTVSIFLDTDPRDPANTAQTPAWLTAARNGLRDVTDQLEAGDDRDARLRWRDLRVEIESELEAIAPAERGRALVRIVALDGSLDHRDVLQVRLRGTTVALADRPIVAPLAEALDHSRPIGVVLVSGERVRLVHWAHGVIDEAGEEAFDLDDEHWRPYRGPSRGTRDAGGATHAEHLEARVEEHRDRFLAAAARATAERLEERRWERVVIAGEGPIVARFRHVLPDAVAERVVAELPINAVDAPEGEIAARLEPAVEELHRRDAIAAADRLNGADRAAVGPAAVLAALAQRQVEHLLIDPYHRPADGPLPDVARDLIDGSGVPLPERAIEEAVAADARVTTLDLTASAALEAADGMLAALRW